MVGDGMKRGKREAGNRNGPARRSRAILAAALSVAGCAKPAAPPPVPAGPPFILYYQDAAGVHRLDAGRGTDSVVISLSRPRLAAATSPDRTLLAIGYAGADSSRLVVVDVRTGAVTRLHAAGKAYHYSLAWSPDGARIAAGFFTERRVGGQMLPAAGDIVIASVDGRIRRAGCEASKVVYAWVATDTIVVGDGRELNPVDIGGCRSNATIRLQGKRELTFSPNARRLFYLATGRVRRGGRNVTAAELHVARYDGSGARRVIGDPYDPQHPRWSPDGNRVAFDVRPPNRPSLRHIAVFDVARERVQFFPSQTPDGTPRDANPVWAPAGAALVHDRAIGGQAEKVLRTLALDPTAIQMEPTVLVSGAPLGSVWGWADDSHVIVVSERGARLVNTAGSVVYQLPPGRSLLHVAPAEP